MGSEMCIRDRWCPSTERHVFRFYRFSFMIFYRLTLTDVATLYFSQLTMKKLVSTTQGARLAGALIEAMMSHMMAHARHSAEELAAELQKGCPDFFGADSRTFYHARDLLQLARDARARKENAVRDKHVNDAIALFMQVPTAGDLSSMCAELVDLRAFHLSLIHI